MYYFLIILSVILFGGSFALNDGYRKREGGSIRASLMFTFTSSVAGLIILMAINGFKFEFTPFTFVIALLASLIGFGFTYCSFKALGRINLSLYSLFSMLGGMVLPFLQGIFFYNEPVTLAKILCFILICIALILTLEKSEKKNGLIYYIGIFILNGMSGVLSKLFTSLPFEKTSAEGYSILIALCTIIFSGLIILIFFKKEKTAPSISSLAFSASSGIANKIANMWLVIALANVDASVQYPMVTGGVMIVSTIICFLSKKRPSNKELVSVLIAFLGMLALFAIPI